MSSAPRPDVDPVLALGSVFALLLLFCHFCDAGRLLRACFVLDSLFFLHHFLLCFLRFLFSLAYIFFCALPVVNFKQFTLLLLFLFASSTMPHRLLLRPIFFVAFPTVLFCSPPCSSSSYICARPPHCHILVMFFVEFHCVLRLLIIP